MKGDKNNRIFVPKSVADELEKVEDNLNKWRKQSNIPILPITGSVSQCLRTIYATDSSHTQLVDNVKGRPLADPWVIAHAIDPKACVVTKEAKTPLQIVPE